MKRKEWRDITKSELEALYRKYPSSAIAAMYGVTEGAVAYRRRFFGLTSDETGFRHNPGPKRRFSPPKDELANLYGKMSMRDVAAHYGVGETVIFLRLKQYGIPVRSRSESLTGKKKSLEHRLAMSQSRIGRWPGNKNPNWKGGISGPNRMARSKAAYFEWKNAVFKRANHKCEMCGIEHGTICNHCGHRVYLHAHHIQDFAKNPKLRYEPSNGKALCERCHDSEHDKKIG